MDEQNTHRISPYQHDSTADARQCTLKLGQTFWIRSTGLSQPAQTTDLQPYAEFRGQPLGSISPDSIVHLHYD